MTERISHEDLHKDWSDKQLALFREMGTRERLNSVKSGGLEHWTEADRDAALNLIGGIATNDPSPPAPRTVRFEPAVHPLPEQTMRATRWDWFMIAASGGWTGIIITTAAHAYGLF